jgi:hypothetical protein
MILQMTAVAVAAVGCVEAWRDAPIVPDSGVSRRLDTPYDYDYDQLQKKRDGMPRRRPGTAAPSPQAPATNFLAASPPLVKLELLWRHCRSRTRRGSVLETRAHTVEKPRPAQAFAAAIGGHLARIQPPRNRISRPHL